MIDWFKPLNKHTYKKNINSIMSPGDFITFPQFLVEAVIYNRIGILREYKNIQRGPGWSNQLQKEVRTLNQQAYTLLGYFPSIDEDPLVIVAFKNYFRRSRPLKLGQFRKTRYTEKNGRKILNITQIEKDIITAVDFEYQKLKEQQNMMATISASQPKPQEIIITEPSKSDISIDKIEKQPEKNRFSKILEMEKKLNG